MIQQTAVELICRSTFCGKGDRPDQFQVRLCGIDVAGEDVLAIGDREIKRFGREGILLQRIATRDAGWSVAADASNLWVGMQGAIDRMDRQGQVIESLNDPTRLGRITSLASYEDLLFAADATNRTIHLYRKGVWQREVGQEANTRGFMIPNGVLDLAIDVRKQVLLVAHSQKHRVEQYDFDGKFIGSFGRFGVADPAGFGGCCNPTNVALVGDDVVATSVKAPPGIKLYTTAGGFLEQTSPDLFDANTKNIDLVADSFGHLYATDPMRCEIKVFDVNISA